MAPLTASLSVPLAASLVSRAFSPFRCLSRSLCSWRRWGCSGCSAMRCSTLIQADLSPLQVLSAAEYSKFCLATEGMKCDEERWDAHCKLMGADPALGLECSHFSKLYKDRQFPRHFGKLALDMPRVRDLLAWRALLPVARRLQSELNAQRARAPGCVCCSGGLGATAGAPAGELRAGNWVRVAV